MLLGSALHQKLGQPGRKAGGRGEAKPEALRDEARPARQGLEGSGRDDLLTQALASANMVMAWKRVKANRGSAGVDGRTIVETAAYLRTHWPGIREALLNGSYRPESVRRVQIPKTGGGMRELGIPTVTDRLIQQALLQVLQPMIDPTFSEYSFGFRPGRRAHDAVLTARRYVQDGYRMVVDVDLEKFFDRVNHDILMERLSRRIDDKAVLRLIRRYLVAGIMDGGVVMQRYEGTPQGGPLTPRTQRITCGGTMASWRLIRTGRVIRVAGRRHGGWDRMANGDAVRTDDDFLDQQPDNTLAFNDIEGVNILAHPAEERR
jgi:group II intron reverse transcriptase/maturase